MMQKMLSATTVIVYGYLCLTVTGQPPIPPPHPPPPTPSMPLDFPSHFLQNNTKEGSSHKLKSICCIKPQSNNYLH